MPAAGERCADASGLCQAWRDDTGRVCALFSHPFAVDIFSLAPAGLSFLRCATALVLGLHALGVWGPAQAAAAAGGGGSAAAATAALPHHAASGRRGLQQPTAGGTAQRALLQSVVGAWPASPVPAYRGYILPSGNGADLGPGAVVFPGLVPPGTPLLPAGQQQTVVASLEACAALCRAQPQCNAFAFCSTQVSGGVVALRLQLVPLLSRATAGCLPWVTFCLGAQL